MSQKISLESSCNKTVELLENLKLEESNLHSVLMHTHKTMMLIIAKLKSTREELAITKNLLEFEKRRSILKDRQIENLAITINEVKRPCICIQFLNCIRGIFTRKNSNELHVEEIKMNARIRHEELEKRLITTEDELKDSENDEIIPSDGNIDIPLREDILTIIPPSLTLLSFAVDRHRSPFDRLRDRQEVGGEESSEKDRDRDGTLGYK